MRKKPQVPSGRRVWTPPPPAWRASASRETQAATKCRFAGRVGAGGRVPTAQVVQLPQPPLGVLGPRQLPRRQEPREGGRLVVGSRQSVGPAVRPALAVVTPQQVRRVRRHRPHPPARVHQQDRPGLDQARPPGVRRLDRPDERRLQSLDRVAAEVPPGVAGRVPRRPRRRPGPHGRRRPAVGHPPDRPRQLPPPPRPQRLPQLGFDVGRAPRGLYGGGSLRIGGEKAPGKQDPDRRDAERRGAPDPSAVMTIDPLRGPHSAPPG